MRRRNKFFNVQFIILYIESSCAMRDGDDDDFDLPVAGNYGEQVEGFHPQM